MVCAQMPGGVEVLRVVQRPSPQPDGTRVLVRVEASSVNRVDVDVRRGLVPGARFPRVLGTECAGTVSEDPTGRLRTGQKVVAFLGGLGRSYDGTYARFAAIEGERVFPVRTDLDWVALAALPVAYLVAAGALCDRLELMRAHTLLVRGASSAIGLAAVAIACDAGVRVVATTRSPDKIDRIRAAGAAEVLVDTGAVSEDVRELVPAGVDRTLDLIGPTVRKDSLAACAEGGRLCAAGTLGGLGTRAARWALAPLLERVSLSEYDLESEPADLIGERLQGLADAVAAGRLPAGVDTVYGLDEVASAHQLIEDDRTCGKLVLRLAKQ